MSEPATKRQPIDLDEFERRLRGTAPTQRPATDDPLAELARLVGGEKDPFAQVFDPAHAGERPRAASRGDWGGPPKVEGFDQRGSDPGLRGAFDSEADWLRAPPQVDTNAYRTPKNFAPDPRNYDPSEVEPHMADDRYAPEPADFGAEGRAPRSRRSLYMMGGALAVVLLGIGTTFALKGGASGSRQPPTILAAAGPSKVQPPEQSTADSVSTTSMLDKDNADTSGPTRVINRVEEPVDLSQAARPGNVRSVFPGQSGSNPAPANPIAQQAPLSTPFGEPKRVRTIAVRPDGTFISADNGQPVRTASAGNIAPVPAAAPFPPQRQFQAAATPQTPAPAKAPIRVTTPTPAQRVAEAATSDAGPLQLGATTPAGKAPTRVAARTPEPANAAETSSGAGGFAVQLAAASSEAEAREKMTVFSRKFSAQLGGHRLGYKQGDSNGKSVWRVRVGGMTQQAAIELCNNLKTGGGACFVARN